jgi:hypothetical protein
MDFDTWILILIGIIAIYSLVNKQISKETTMSNDTILDMDALLDGNLGAVENVPDFVTPPAGDYELSIKDASIEKYDWPAKGDKKAQKGLQFKLVYQVDKTLDTKDLPVADGSLFSRTYRADEDGMKYFKKAAREIMNVKDIDDVTIRDILDTLKGQAFKAQITIRSKDGYDNVNVRPVHDAPAE